MGMKLVRVVMQSVGVADGILGMKPLLKAVQNSLQRTPQNDVGIDFGTDQFVVKSVDIVKTNRCWITGLDDEVLNSRMCFIQASQILFFRSELLRAIGEVRLPS
jgi:hypothetical protein